MTSIRARCWVLSIALLSSLSAIGERPVEGISPAAPLLSRGSAANPDIETSAYRKAAEAIRERNYAAARTHLEPLTGRADAVGRQARLVLGLYAHATEELAEAVGLLSEADSDGELEDWRLFILADTWQALAEPPAAQEALGRLLAVHPESPLHESALIGATTLARDKGNLHLVLALIDSARSEGMTAARADLEVLAWEIGATLEQPEVQKEAARRLLVEQPLKASKLQVIEIFRQPTGELDWLRVLSVPQFERRASRLLDLRLYEEALTALGFVPEDQRSFGWHLLQAQSLTRARRGREAQAMLESIDPTDDRERAWIAWHRALAGLEVVTVRRGRTNLSSAQRKVQRQEALRHLRTVVELGGDRATSLAALRLLFEELVESDRFGEAMETLETLRKLQPTDKTGARLLWRRGWGEHGKRNYSGAIGYWSRLEQLYPESSLARSGRYWTARSHDQLGNHPRAKTIFRELVAVETSDFYRRHALARLGESSPLGEGAPQRPTEPWPEDRRLDRAHLLSELGLDDLALMELLALEGQADRRAFRALQAVILARQGKHRESIQALRKAFHNLGGAHQSMVPERALYLYYPLAYQVLVDKYAKQHNLSLHLVLGMIRQESAFDPTAQSWAGARGLMQMMPATGRDLARRIGLRYSTQRLTDPEFSIRLGTAYFRQVLEMFDGNEQLALAGYNAGPYRIKRLWRRAGSAPELDRFLEDLHMEETTTYVKRVVLFTDSYRQLYGETAWRRAPSA